MSAPRTARTGGYLPFGRDFVTASVGGMAPPDWRETFGFGRFDMPSDDPYFADPEAGYAYQPNILPTEVDGLAETAGEYYRALEGVERPPARHLRMRAGPGGGLPATPFRPARVDSPRYQLPRTGRPAGGGTASLRRAHRFRLAYAADGRRRAGRAPGPRSLRDLGRRLAAARHLCGQYRRPVDDLDQRPLALQLSPRGQPATGRFGAHPAPVGRLLRAAQLRRRHRVHRKLPRPPASRPSTRRWSPGSTGTPKLTRTTAGPGAQ